MWWWISEIVDRVRCKIEGHDWHYGSLGNLDGSLALFRCCMRVGCETTQDMEQAEWLEGRVTDRW